MRILPKSLEKHWKDPNELIQVILGPRQVGKTTAVQSLTHASSNVYASADLPSPPTAQFIVDHWTQARDQQQKTLVLDEIQKIPRWSETVKMLWDEDRSQKRSLNVWILGSSALLLDKGLSESLTGRFEINYFPHWIYAECKKVFNASLAEYIQFGGYPKVYSFRSDRNRGFDYVQNGIIETTLGRDILTLHAVEKPALLRQLFWYVSKLPAQIVSYEKILGHLQGKGNSATLVHYSELLEMAFLLLPIPKFSSKPHRTKKSIPKWILPNPALVDESIREVGLHGFPFENLVGSHMANLLFGDRRYSLRYWREEQNEIDFILCDRGKARLAIEVKSGRKKKTVSKSIRISKGIDCPFLIVDQVNVEGYLSTTSVDEVFLFSDKNVHQG